MTMTEFMSGGFKFPELHEMMSSTEGEGGERNEEGLKGKDIP